MTHSQAARQYAENQVTPLGISQGFDFAWYVAQYIRFRADLVGGQEIRKVMGFSSTEIAPSDVLDALNAD